MSAPRDLATIQGFLGETFRGMTPLGDRPDLHAAIAAIVAGNDRLTPAEQAEIYREQFWLRHRDVLRDDYPALRHLIGDEPFDDLVRAYLEACPPRSYTLRDLGDRLAEFARSYDRFPPERPLWPTFSRAPPSRLAPPTRSPPPPPTPGRPPSSASIPC